MMLDLLASLANKELYDKFSPLIKKNMLSKEGETIFLAMGKYFDKDPHTTKIEWADFAGWFTFTNRKLHNEAQKELYNNIFSKLVSHVVDETVIKNVLYAVIEESYAAIIHNKALDIVGGSGDTSMEDIQRALDDFNKEVEKYSDDKLDYVDLSDVEYLVRATMGEGGLDWRLDYLNISVGSLRKGHFVIVGARPDAGKSTFLISEAVNWARQIADDESVLWFNNEEAGEKIGIRTIVSGIGWTDEEVHADPIGAGELFKKKIGSHHKIKQIKQEIFTVKEIESYCKKYNPRVIIFDQLWKIVGFAEESANETSRQSLLFAWARALAGKYGPTITVHQLGGESEGERFPMMKNLYGSQTAIQGEADVIIFLGKSKDDAEQKYRFLSIAKNKLGHGPKCDKSKRHAKFLLEMDTDHACFKEVSEYVIT